MDWMATRRCTCCGMVPVWFGCRTWCPCEPTPLRATVHGQPHECTGSRRLHVHHFERCLLEVDASAFWSEVVFRCNCAQERRLDPGLLEAS